MNRPMANPIAVTGNHARCFATTKAEPPIDHDEETYTLRYLRASKDSKPLRWLLGLSSFNMAYFGWYCVDFVPSVNKGAIARFEAGEIDQATLELLWVDSSIGYAGLGVGALISFACYQYTTQVVAAIWSSPNDTLAVSTLKLPGLSEPSVLKRTVYDPETNDFDELEDIVFHKSELMAEPNVQFYQRGELALADDQMQQSLILEYDGDFSRLVGHIALAKRDKLDSIKTKAAPLFKTSYLISGSSGEFTSNSGPALLRSLVLPEQDLDPPKPRKKARNVSEEEDDKDSKEMIRTNIGESIRKKKGFRNKRSK